jgi:iron complex transport system permease protein
MSATVAERTRPGTPTKAPRTSAGRVLGLIIAIAVLLLISAASLVIGTRSTSVATVWQALTHVDSSDTDQLVIVELRLPRLVLGLLVGAALGLAGTVMQGVTRNPLADPGILGIDSGAALCVVVAIGVFHISSVLGYVWFAFIGAAVAAAVVYGVASLGREGATPIKLALSGAAVSAALTSVTTVFLLGSQQTFDQFRFWQVGALTGRDLGIAARVAPFLVCGSLLALLTGRLLNTLSLGADVARGLGARVGTARVICAVSVVLLCGAATAACGPIAFVGLTIPHVARMIVGADYRWTLPYAMVLAPSLLLAADIIGRVVVRPGEVQVGIITAVIGAPVFIALVRRRRLAEL